MTSVGRAVGVALVAWLGVVACGGGDGGGNGGPTPSPTPTPTPDAGTQQAVITIQNFRFSPDNLEVAPGATVTVTNMDSAEHSVTSQAKEGDFTKGAVNGVSFDTGEFASGSRTFTIPANAPSGTVVPYFCTEHKSGMANTGRITIR